MLKIMRMFLYEGVEVRKGSVEVYSLIYFTTIYIDIN